ncbi:hypothetical protein GCM10029976_014320 [Kribbella albertanoniae]|uniref:DUF3592 domain-containing protein n=1 Tax=Kribbella albertanoniae TaxID=1266829 RepID=A0A4R4PHL8_9ACTN|nr:hypothetical protein [Kribbella albertanoniae]TDC21356.1 hypothetical protein E1261_33490 [Kribbella albertanoniae]
MSTVDPIAARRAKRLRRAGQPKVLAGAVAAGIAQLGAGVCFGVSIGILVEFMRSDVTNSVFADQDPGMDGFLGLATMPVMFIAGTFGLVVFAAVTRHLIDLYRGGEKQPIVQFPATLWAIAAGVTGSALSWEDPADVGIKVDPVFHHDQTWSTFGWVMYRADIWLPALAVVIAVLATLYAIKHNRRLRTQIAERNRLLTAGRKVPGEITNVAVRTSQNDQGQRSVVGAEVVVKFTDLQGTDRWVTRQARDRSAIPTVSTALVLFDPQRPDADDLIFVSFTPDPLPGDWIGTIA